MSGGGSSIIAIPLFATMNISLVLATAIQKVSAVFWVIPAARNYLTDRKIDWRFLIFFTILGLIGVFLGVILLVSITQQSLKVLIGVLILIMVFYVFLKKDFGLKSEKEVPNWKKRLSYVFAPLFGFYESIFGSGNGILFSVAGVKTRGYELSESLGYYYAIAFAWVVVTAAILISKGFYDVPIMTIAVIGSTLGGHLGSKFARYKGNKFIKYVFCIIGLILGLKLIVGF
jgi:uncharacterized membrane protein YfcA